MTALKVRADYEQLTQIAQEFCRQSETTQQVLRALQNDVNTLQRGDWVGKGANAFYAEMNGAVLPAMTRLVGALSEASNTTERISRIMKQAEVDAAALFRLVGAEGAPTATLGAASLTAAPADAVAAGAASAEPPTYVNQQTGWKTVYPGWVRIGKSPFPESLPYEILEDKDGNRILVNTRTGDGVRLPSRQEEEAAEQKRRQEKRAAAKQAADEWNDLADMTQTTAAVGTIAGDPIIAGPMLLLSIISRRVARHYTYQALSDPPRDDFHLITKFQTFEVPLPEVGIEVGTTWHGFLTHSARLSSATQIFVTSLERYDGIQLAKQAAGADAAKLKELAAYEIAQVEAVAHNAAACADLASSVVALRSSINAAWQQTLGKIGQASTVPPGLTPEEAGQKLDAISQSQSQALISLGLLAEDIAQMRQATTDMIREHGLPADLPQELLNDQWSETMQTLSTRMREFAESYSHLVMQAASP